MKNGFTIFLLENGWKEKSPMTYINDKNEGFEIFFDNSNQIELYIFEERKPVHI